VMEHCQAYMTGDNNLSLTDFTHDNLLKANCANFIISAGLNAFAYVPTHRGPTMLALTSKHSNEAPLAHSAEPLSTRTADVHHHMQRCKEDWSTDTEETRK
jgi:hypothetical protein